MSYIYYDIIFTGNIFVWNLLVKLYKLKIFIRLNCIFKTGI